MTNLREKSPSELEAQFPGNAYFFIGAHIETVGAFVRDNAVYESGLALHQLTVSDAEMIYREEPEVAVLIFGEDGTCRNQFYYRDDVNSTLGFDLNYRFSGHNKFAFSGQGRPMESWAADPAGASVLGGDAPQAFVFPERKHPLNYQYLGFLANADLPVAVDGDGIHLIFSMLHYDTPFMLFDITDPLAPKPFENTSCAMVEGAKIVKQYCPSGAADPVYEGYNAFQEGDTLTYEPLQISRQKVTSWEAYDLASASHPRWRHAPQIPICPKTGEAMLFLGQFGDGRPSVENDFVRRTREAGEPAAASVLAFETIEGGSGIYAFYHPVGRTLAILTQD